MEKASGNPEVFDHSTKIRVLSTLPRVNCSALKEKRNGVQIDNALRKEEKNHHHVPCPRRSKAPNSYNAMSFDRCDVTELSCTFSLSRSFS